MEPVLDLDDPGQLEQADPGGMLDMIGGFPRQVREALEIGSMDVELPSAEGIETVVVMGMGGSGITGDVVNMLARGGGFDRPFMTEKGYHVPPYVDGNTLAIAVSYSGNTEETLSCMEQARERGARMVAVSSDGKLEEAASRYGMAFFKIPGGLQPRASLGYLVVPALSAMERMGLVRGQVEKVRGALPMLEERSREYGAENPLEENPTKRLAKGLLGYLPVIYGSEGPLAVAAMRWKTQFNENAKTPAFHHYFSELNHNETVGWQNLEDVCSRCYIIILREKDMYPRIEKRIEITSDLLEDFVGHVAHVYARGGNETERLLDAIYFGDWTSLYLALAIGQDPTPVVRIEELKKRLAD